MKTKKHIKLHQQTIRSKKEQLEIMKVAKHIRTTRKRLNLSQQRVVNDMANYYNKNTVCRTSLAQWENGRIDKISGSHFLKLAKVLGVDPQWLMFGKS